LTQPQAITAAVPGYAGLELRTVDKLQGFDIVDLHVKHPDFEGIFTGTADFIYKEFKTLKPEVFINDTSAASNNVLPLEKRQTNGEVSLQKTLHYEM
jgi:hypothetical protein